MSCVIVVSEFWRDTMSSDGVIVGWRDSVRLSIEGSGENSVGKSPLPLPMGENEVLDTASMVRV